MIDFWDVDLDGGFLLLKNCIDTYTHPYLRMLHMISSENTKDSNSMRMVRSSLYLPLKNEMYQTTIIITNDVLACEAEKNGRIFI